MGRAPALFPAYHSSPLPIPQDHLGILKNALARSREIRYNGSKNPLCRELAEGDGRLEKERAAAVHGGPFTERMRSQNDNRNLFRI